MNNQTEIFDGRAIPCSEKHGQIIEKWQSLPVGQSFILINNHDPLRLKKQFGELWPETFAWKYLAQNPDEYRIQITKLKVLPETGTPSPLHCGH
jgi:uncharacterized protein (DUF2249 family)